MDKITDFAELSRNISQLPLKRNWSYFRSDSSIVISKVSTEAAAAPPKLTTIVKIDQNLEVAVWVDDVPLKVDLFWQLLGISATSLHLSSLQQLVTFLDSNQMLVTNRKKRWDSNPSGVREALSRAGPYCRLCFKSCTHDVSRIDSRVTDLIMDTTLVELAPDESFSRVMCQECADYLSEIERFRRFVTENEALLRQVDEVEAEPEDKMVLIKAGMSLADILPSRVHRGGGSRHFCALCSKKFPYKSLLTAHRRRYHTRSRGTKVCGACREEFCSIRQLRDHRLGSCK